MGHRFSRRAVALATATVALWAAAPVLGALPLVAGLGKQLVQDLLIDGIKSQLIGSLSGMGCKGAALASVLSGGKGAVAGMLGGALLPGGMAMPSGMAMPPGMAPGMAMPAGAMPGAVVDSPMMALMQQQLGARAGAMPTVSPEQMAQIHTGMAAMQQAMAQPLSRGETLAVFDELGELGVMTPAMQSEVRDCIMLAPPSASAALGTTGALMKNMMLPQLRIAREQMANLQPEEREQLATEIAQAMKDLPPEDRKAFQEGFGAGFFPADVVTAVKNKLR
ncbi:MAG TPA: hypothetical protein VLJ62_32540 [Burkholderiaceae bacterium]|nr:hypothetical protein [Burkholderiaceae bacterium]